MVEWMLSATLIIKYNLITVSNNCNVYSLCLCKYIVSELSKQSIQLAWSIW